MESGAAPSVRSADTERAILDAARDLLAEGGIDALSMRAMAARVGLSATAIYHWFDNKEALVDRVVADGFRRSESYLWRAIEDLPAGSRERVAALGEAYIRFALENQQYFKVIFAIQTEHPRAVDDLPGRGGYGVLRQCLVEAMEAGSIRREHPDLLALYLWSVVHGLVTIFLACDAGEALDELGVPREGPEDPTVLLFRRFRDVIESGLLPRARGERPHPEGGGA